MLYHIYNILLDYREKYKIEREQAKAEREMKAIRIEYTDEMQSQGTTNYDFQSQDTTHTYENVEDVNGNDMELQPMNQSTPNDTIVNMESVEVHENPGPPNFEEIIAQAREKARRVSAQYANENNTSTNGPVLGQFQNLAQATAQISGSVARLK